jgi:hypothetical protein
MARPLQAGGRGEHELLVDADPGAPLAQVVREPGQQVDGTLTTVPLLVARSAIDRRPICAHVKGSASLSGRGPQ